MAVDSVMVARMARLLAFIHIVVGVLLICFGIADRVVDSYYNWTGNVYFGIWIGVWMCVTGGLGIPGTGRDITGSRNVFAGIFMGFSITSAVFGGIIIICYGVAIAIYRDYFDPEDIRHYDTKMAISVIILLLGIAEFGIGIWAAVCCCLMSPCCACCAAAPQQQLYTDNTTGYITTPGVGGYPMATPVQVGGGVVAISHAQAAQPPMVLMPTSGEVGGHPAMAQASATTGMPATVYCPQEPMKPPSHV